MKIVEFRTDDARVNIRMPEEQFKFRAKLIAHNKRIRELDNE